LYEVPLRYRIDVKQTSELDRRVGGGTLEHGEVTTRAFVSLTLRDSANGQVAHFVIDSMVAEPLGDIPWASEVSSAKWLRQAFIDAFVVHGKIQGKPRLSVETLALRPLLDAVRLIFPGAPANAIVGDHWTDTLSLITGTGTETWNVVPHEPGESMVLTQSRTTDMTRPTKAVGETMTATGSGIARVVMDADGAARSATSRRLTKSRLMSSAIPDGVPGTDEMAIDIQRIAHPDQKPNKSASGRKQ